MRLYILGPAFGLPSIDAECVAAVALLQLQCAEGEWRLIPTHDQKRRLPCLVDGGKHVDGFQNIARYFDATKNFSESQHADSTATSSFIPSHAQTLLDISLYVSFENYTVTRTAFTQILPWHANYTIPPARRAAARARTEHLGISSIDADDVHEDLSNRPPAFDKNVGKKEQTFEAETQKKASLLLPRRDTLRSLLQRPQHSAVFRLHALADNFFEPLQAILRESGSEYLLGADQPQALDCLAYGYLSLMLYPPLPYDWLAKIMRKKYETLVQYTERIYERLSLKTNVDAVVFMAQYCSSTEEVDDLRKECSGMALPWDVPEHAGAVDVATTMLHDLVSRIPLIGGTRTEVEPTIPAKRSVWQKYWRTLLSTSATAVGLLGYYAFTTGLLAWPQYGEEVHIFGRKRLADYGHLGAALAGISLRGQQVAASHDPSEIYGEVHQKNPVNVEVAVGRDGVP